MMQQSIRMVQPELQFIDNGFLFGKLVFILFPVSLPGLPETFDCGSQRGNLLPAEFQLVSEPEIFPGKPFALATRILWVISHRQRGPFPGHSGWCHRLYRRP